MRHHDLSINRDLITWAKYFLTDQKIQLVINRQKGNTK